MINYVGLMVHSLFKFVLLPVCLSEYQLKQCRDSCREVRTKAAQTCLPHLLVLVSFSCLCSYYIIIARLEMNLPNVARFILILQVVIWFISSSL